jgi:hypothetical protein
MLSIGAPFIDAPVAIGIYTLPWHNPKSYCHVDHLYVQGPIPRSWKWVAKQLTFVDVRNNAGLQGCIHADGAKVFTQGTNATGACAPDALVMEQQQRNAMLTLLPQLVPDVRTITWYNASLQLGSLVFAADKTRVLRDEFSGTLMIWVVDGIEYVAGLAFGKVSLNMSRLVAFVQQMPHLQWFSCSHCNATGQHFPPGLAAAAALMWDLSLKECGLAGPLPASWGNWSSLQYLELPDNSITGTLPESFAALSSLKVLDLSSNKLQGILPMQWGQQQVMPKRVRFDLSSNPALSGTIPAAWAHFSRTLDATDTNIHGCRPRGFIVYQKYELLPHCVHRLCTHVVASLLKLKRALQKAAVDDPTGLNTWTSGTHAADSQQQPMLSLTFFTWV